MHYVVSDIHGHFKRFLDLLKLINFSNEDTLYIIGDVIDRGPEPIALLQYIMTQPNMIMTLGNHEFIMDVVHGKELLGHRDFWYENGGKVTDEQFKELRSTERNRILDFIESLPISIEVEVAGVLYELVHSKPATGRYEKGSIDEILEMVDKRMKPYTVIPKDRIIVFGHTVTTPAFHITTPYSIWFGDNRVGIDCGIVG